MVRRVFRIYPTCAAVVILTSVATAAYCFYQSVPSPNTWSGIASSALILNGFTYQFSTVPVLWTLEIELLFYCVIALACLAFGRLQKQHIMVLSVVCAVLGFILDRLDLGPHPAHLGSMLNQVTLIVVGSMIYRVYADGWTVRGCLFIAASFIVFLISYKTYTHFHPGVYIGIDIPNALWSLAVFVSAMVLKMEWRWLRPLAWFGDLSYPLYLIHVPLGWYALTVFSDLGLGMHLSAFLAFVLCVACAWVVHVVVERPSLALGRTVTSGSLFTGPIRGAA